MLNSLSPQKISRSFPVLFCSLIPFSFLLFYFFFVGSDILWGLSSGHVSDTFCVHSDNPLSKKIYILLLLHRFLSFTVFPNPIFSFFLYRLFLLIYIFFHCLRHLSIYSLSHVSPFRFVLLSLLLAHPITQRHLAQTITLRYSPAYLLIGSR